MLGFFKIWGEKIGPVTATGLVAFALCLDGIQAMFDALVPIPVIGIIFGTIVGEYFTIVGGVFLACWLWYLDAPFVTRLTLAAVIEFIPIINILPAFTAATVLSIMAANNKQFGQFLSFATLRFSGALAGAAGAMEGGGAEAPGKTPSDSKGGTGSERGGFGHSKPTFKAPPATTGNNPQRQNPPNDGLLVEPRQRVSA